MKKILVLLAVVFTALQMSAADVTASQAQAAANAFLTKQVRAGNLRTSAASNLKLVKAEASVFKPTAVDYYIFNSANSYVVISGDDQAPQILMYGEEGPLDLDNIPPGMQWLLNKYKYQIDGLKAGTMAPVDIPKTATVAVPPLVTANWDQGKPYYNHTPTSGGTHAYTGCPATSLAMCFYLYKWPKTYPALPAIAANSYYGYLAATALSEKEADWDNIIDEYTGPSNYSYTSAQAEAVSWLMRYVGQACNMGYTTSGSGATDPEILEACHTFGYTDAQLLILTELVQSGWNGYTNGTQKYTDAQWNEYMLNELYSGRPIEYLAYDITSGQVSGHAFNVFGCNTSGQYYVNWGWSGDSNGYCTLHNFTTNTGATGQSGSYTFKYGEAMIIGIAPPDGSVAELTVSPTTLTFTGNVGGTTTKTFTVSGTDLKGDVTINCSGNYYSVSPTTLTKEEAEAGATVTVTYKPTVSGSHSGTITVSSTNAESKKVTLTGTATQNPTITVDPASLTFNTIVDQPVTSTFVLKGVSLTNSVSLQLSDRDMFSIDKVNVSKSAANSGTTVTVTYTPYEVGTHNAEIVLSSSGAESVTLPLTGHASLETYAPVMVPAIEQYINLTKFRADWTDATPDENVASYTLEVSTKAEPEPEPELIASVVGTDYTSSQSYYDITLPAPWGGKNLRGANSRAIYFRNKVNNVTSLGNITYTVPEGYENATFTVKITTDYGSDGAGNVTVATPQTAAVGHDFSTSETYTWLVTASSGENITFTSSDANYSPDMATIEIYSGNATVVTLKSTESGDATWRVITDITDKFYTVENLTAEGTFLYKVKAIYVDGTESDWSNIEEVTLFENGHGFEPGDLNHNGELEIEDLALLIDYVLDSSISTACPICADVDQSGEVDIKDVADLIDMVLGGGAPAALKLKKTFYLLEK